MVHSSDPNKPDRPGTKAPASSPIARLLRLGSLVGRVLDLVFKVLDEERPYRFGYDDQLLRQIMENNLSNFGEAKDIRFPHDIIFINRTAAGHFGNLSRLRAAAPWRRMVEARVA